MKRVIYLNLDLDNTIKKITENKFVKNFLNELNKNLSNPIESHNNNVEMPEVSKNQDVFKEGEIYIVYNSEKDNQQVNLLEVSTGELYGVDIKKLPTEDIQEGDNYIYENNKFSVCKSEFNVSSRAWSLLEPLYFNLKEEDGRHYEVTEIDNDKIHIRDTRINAKYIENKSDYPDWNVGDKFVRKNGEYVKESKL